LGDNSSKALDDGWNRGLCRGTGWQEKWIGPFPAVVEVLQAGVRREPMDFAAGADDLMAVSDAKTWIVSPAAPTMRM
jgi:hypothetical protein